MDGLFWDSNTDIAHFDSVREVESEVIFKTWIPAEDDSFQVSLGLQVSEEGAVQSDLFRV